MDRELSDQELQIVTGGGDSKGNHDGTGPGTGMHNGLGWLVNLGQQVRPAKSTTKAATASTT